MLVDLDAISENLNRIKDKLGEAKRIVPPQKKPIKSVDEEVDEELEKPYYKYQEEDTRFITKCYKYLHNLGLVESQYQFSEQFLNKNNCANKKCPVDNFYA